MGVRERRPRGRAVVLEQQDVLETRVAPEVPPNQWEVRTDRGATRLTLEDEDEIRRVGPDRFLITDRSGVRYLIPSLRALRAKAHTIPTLKELSTEQYQVIYEQPIRERNFYADDPNKHHADRARERDKSVGRFVERGVWPESESVETEITAG